MFGNFEEEARKILVEAKREMYELRHPYVSSEHLLLSILKSDNDIARRLKRFNLDYKIFKNEVIKILGKGNKESKWFLYTPLLKRILENAVIDAKENNSGEVTVNHLFISLIEEGEGVAIRILLGMNIDIDELYNEFTFKLNTKTKNRKLFIDEIGIDLNEKALSGNVDIVTGRDKEVKRILEILSRRNKNNPILIGKAGVGKTAIVEFLASMIVSDDVPLSLRGKRIISLDMASSVAGTKYRGEFEERMNKILKEIEENDDIILFIDEVHTLVGAGGAEGAIDASNIFKPALARGKIRCIGATTTDEYKRYIEKDSALERRFQKVNIEEPDKKTLKDIMMNLKGIYEKFHGVTLSEAIIDLIIDLSDKYIYNRNEPDRSIDILDEVCARVSLKESKDLKEYRKYNKEIKDIIRDKKNAIIKNDFDKASDYKNREYELMDKINYLELSLCKKKKQKVTKTDVAKVINMKSEIPIYEILNEKKSIVKNISKQFKSQIIGQDSAVKNMENIFKKIKMGYNDGVYSILFCGPSGVGKTKLAMIFAQKLVGEKNVIKVDCSEFREPHSISKIIGSPPGYVGYEDNHYLLEEIKDKPYCILILDEIEKASSSIINLFLGVLDEAIMKNSKGESIHFDNVVIIMTSNVGFLNSSVGFNTNQSQTVKLNENFSIPFMNRVDSIVEFNKLNKKDITKIVIKKLDEIIKKYKLKIDIKYSKTLIEDIVNASNYKIYGARKIDKVIKEKVESKIIDSIIENKKTIYIEPIESI